MRKVICGNLQKFKNPDLHQFLQDEAADYYLLQETLESQPLTNQRFFAKGFKDSGCSIETSPNKIILQSKALLSPTENFTNIRKATAIVETRDLFLISTHGHNGFPFRQVGPLREQIKEVLCELQVMMRGREKKGVLWSGDFNTFTERRTKMLIDVMASAGFKNYSSAKYDEKRTLDYVFAKNLTFALLSTHRNVSDHPILNLAVFP